MKISNATKILFVAFICILISICYSVGICSVLINQKEQQTIINNYTNQIQTKEVEYSNQSSLPNGSASASTIINSLNSSVAVTVASTSGYNYGSGTLIATDNLNYSYIITCHHVIENSRTKYVSVTFYDGSTETAEIVGGDKQSDVAVLKINSINHTISEYIKNNNQIFAGENVYIIGNSLGEYDFSVTTGCLSHKTERSVTVSGYGTFNVLQTDGAVNGGVSGGGMFDTNGTLIGMINCGYDCSVAQNINFVLPIYDVMNIAKQLLENTDEETGFGYIPGRYNIELSIATWGENPSYVLVTSVPEKSSFYGTDKLTSLMAYDLLKTVKIGENETKTLSSATEVVNIFDQAKENNQLEVGTQIQFLVAENRGIDNIEHLATITIKQYVFSI